VSAHIVGRGVALSMSKQELASLLGEGKLDRELAYALMRAPWEEVGELLLEAASGLRDRHKGRDVSYSRKVFIPLTNLCRDLCGYCAYRKEAWDPGARTLTPSEVLRLAEFGKRTGCTEALFMTGERPEQRYGEAREQLRRLGYATFIEYLRDMCELVAKKVGLLPHSNPGTMTLKEVSELKEVNASLGMMLENVSERLCARGGPHERAPSKHPRARLATLENAGRLRVPFTTGILVGIGETPEELVDSLFAIKELHGRYGHIQEVIVQNFRPKPGTPMAGHPEPDRRYMLKAVALARLILGGDMNVQVPPNLSYRYGEYLGAGINDWGGVSPVTLDYVNPEASWPTIRELRAATEERGHRLRHRLPVYPEFVVRKKEFLPKGLEEAIMRLAGPDGYARQEVVE
jgi:FO synthase subunit 1